MDPVWLIRNIVTSWQHRASAMDFARCLLWTYSAKLPQAVRKREWAIDFRYRLPIGDIRLLLRANAGSDRFIHSEVFEHEYYRLPIQKPPGTILDLGANAGFTAVYFGRVHPSARLACVEPIPGNLRMLTRNLESNAIQAVVIPAAVDVHDGRLQMELAPLDFAHKVSSGSKSPSQASIEVAALSIPTILERLGWERIGLLKVDIEGHEKVLFSADCEWLRLVDAMCIECHEGFESADLRALARRFGFRRPQLLSGIWLMTREAED